MNGFKTIPRRPAKYQAPRNKVSARWECTEVKWSSWGEGDGSSEQSSSRQSHRMANNTESSLSRSMDLRVSSQWRQSFSSEGCLPVKHGEKVYVKAVPMHMVQKVRGKDEAHYVSPKKDVRLWRKWHFRVPNRMLPNTPDNRKVDDCFFRKIVCWHLTRCKCMEGESNARLGEYVKVF